MAFTPVGDDPLCIGRDAHDSRPTCGGVAYPAAYGARVKAGCVFAFKPAGGQKITARFDASQGFAEWEPITVDGHPPPC